MYIRLFRDAAASGGGGGPVLPPSLFEIEEELRLARERGDDPSEETIPEGKIKNEAGELIDDPNYKKPETKTPEELAAEEAAKKAKEEGDEKDPEDKGDETEPTPEDFWKEVETLTGRPVKVEYPEGMDPLSPQGVAHREGVLRDAAIDEWEEKIKKANPRGFAFLLHTASGGSEQEFFEQNQGFTLPERGVVEGDVDLQSQIMKNDLVSKGVDEDIADAQVAKAIKENKLKEKSLKIYDGEAKRQTDYLAQLEAKKVAEDNRVQGLLKGLDTSVDKLLPELSFVVPEAQRADFKKFVMEHTELDPRNNKFYIIQALDETNPKAQLESLFFQYTKGDLSKIIKKKVSTEASQRLRTAANKTKTGAKQGEEENKHQTQFVSLGSLGNGVPQN